MSKEHLSPDQVKSFLAANSDVDFRSIDLLTKKGDLGLNWGSLKPEAHKESLRVYQRLLSVSPSVEVAARLIGKGIISANHLARIPRKIFINDHAADLGISKVDAADMHRRATGIRNKTLQLWASVRGTIASPFVRNGPLDNVGDDVKELFENLPSYQELFGTLDYCACEECRSIFGAAAYLVDLLRIIDEYITKPNTIKHEFQFNTRRPDIQLIDLTCVKTTTLVPYLQIVNERLIARAAASLDKPEDSIIQELATTLIYPQALPFNALLDQIRVLLDRVGAGYGSILSAWKSSPTTVAARSLGLSPEQQTIDSTPLTTKEAVAPYYNVAADKIDTLSDAQTFLDKTWSTFGQLLGLVNQDLSIDEQKAGLQVNFFINQGLNGDWVKLEQEQGTEKYVLKNLGIKALDQINRLLRLAKEMGLSAIDVDWALRCIQAGGAPVIAGSFPALFALMGAAKSLSLGFAEVTVMLGPIKTYGVGPDGTGSTFDRLFNPSAMVAKQGLYQPAENPLNPAYKSTPLPWTPGSNKDDDVAAINRVLPGLGLTLDGANSLGLFLFSNGPLKLTVEVLSVLYRHALLSRALQLPADRYILFLKLNSLANPKAPTASELTALIAAAQWLNDTGVNVYQLDYIINGTPSVYVNPMYQPGKIDEWLAGLRVNVPFPSDSAGADIAAQVAVLFGASNDLIDSVLAMAVAAEALPPKVTTWEEAFLTLDENGHPYTDYVGRVLLRVSRWLVLAQTLSLATETVASVQSFPAAYGLPADFASLPWTAVANIARVQRMMKQYGDLQQNLLLYIKLVSTGAPLDDALAALQEATSWLPDQVKQLLDGPVKETVISERLGALQTCFDLMNAFGADVSLMNSIAGLGDVPAIDWSKYVIAANLVMAKTISWFGDQWPTVWETLSGDLNVHLRDALLALVMSELNTLYLDIKSPRNVYEFLLTDVEMGSVTQISYILEALNAAQLYLQRCRLRLEPGVTDLSHIQPAWWEWMMNYRVWQANREIFVYPENYLIPTLRKNVTPQFEMLSQTLQESEVTKAYVGSAFRDYIDGFDEVAQLKPVDAYRTSVNDRQTIYLLARTKTGPYTFFYCSQPEDMPWSPWTKIDLTINSPTCSILYAFNRLFLFWNEIKKNNTSAVAGDGGKVSTTNSTTYTSSLMYSFINQQGTWVQPQTLVDQAVILFDSDDGRSVKLKDLDIFAGLFKMDDLVWKKIFPLNVTAKNYDPAQGNVLESERISVGYGPIVINTGALVDAQSVPPSNDPASTAFWLNLHNAAEDHNRMVQDELSGNLLLRPFSVLNMSLEDDVLVHKQEFLLLDQYRAPSPLSWITAEMQSSGAVMQISHTGQPITDNRIATGPSGITTGGNVTGNSFIGSGISQPQSLAIFKALQGAGVLDGNGKVQPAQMATLDLYSVLSTLTVYKTFGPAQYGWVLRVLFAFMESTPLFSSLSGVHTGVAPVSGQPGWFLFFSNDEVFLLSPKPVKEGEPVFSTLAEGLTVGPPLLTSMSSIMTYQGKTPGSINADVSGLIFTALTGFGLIQNGRLTATATLQNITFALGNLVLQNKITNAQIPLIYYALTNAPILFSDAFISPGIDDTKSAKIYLALQNFSLIDPNGRIDESILTGLNVELALSNLLFDGTLTRSQIAGIYTTLAQAPEAVSLSYTNHGDVTGLNSTNAFVFDVTRLSTGAVKKVSRALFAGGVDLLLDLRTQEIPVIPVLPFDRFGPSKQNLNWPTALDATQVDFDGLYGQYFWEIFYHIPMLVAYSLNTNQKFSDALSWYQYIFNPTVAEEFVTEDVIVTDTREEISLQQATGIISQLKAHQIDDPPEPILNDKGEVNPKFTATTDLSFLKVADPSLTDMQVLMVRNILLNYQLNAPASHYWRFRPFRNYTQQTLQDMLSDKNPAIKIYNDDPFDPFAIARLRIGAFEKATVIEYIDNLIAWGDQLFTQDSWESITAAYMLYVYAYNLLGPKPEQVGECPGAGVVLNFQTIQQKYPDGIPQFLLDLEHLLNDTGPGVDVNSLDHAFNDLNVYFCVPENDNLVSRWDVIADRMFKINQSLNIEGVFRVLPLFQPPLNPLDLVKAAAAGNNIQTTVTSTPELSPYRYSAALANAQGLCATLLDLGNSILSALEKKDAAGLSSLRTNQETQLLELMTQIKQDQITQLDATIKSLQAAQAGANYRLAFYTALLSNGLSSYEQTSLSAADAALAFNILGSISKTAATIAYAVPQVGSPFAMTYGGVQLGSAVNAASGVFEIGAEISNFISQRAATMGGYQRRAQDWTLQQQMAQADVNGLVQQIAAANAQLLAAQRDLAVHLKQIAQNKVIEAYVNAQFTNEQLYVWMIGRLASVYFQTYALAMQAARQAEASFQFELDSSRTFLSFDYWDSLHKGLTAGEGLRLALNRLDSAYRAGDARRFEIEKTVSLASIAPDQLFALKTTGKCNISLSEALYDYDYPGQYARKIASIAMSIPAVIGPYQNLKAILTQTKNSVVTEVAPEAVKYLLGLTQTTPARGLRQDWAPNQSIAISRGVDDSGLFVLDFNDPRYLPFENTGAVSEWTLEMPVETNRFDFQSLSDVIISVRYTARFDGGLETDVKNYLGQVPLDGGVYITARMQSAAWQAFLTNHSDATKQTLSLKIDVGQIGYFKKLTFTTVLVQLNLGEDVTLSNGATFLSFKAGSEAPQTPTLDNAQGEVKNLTWNGKTLGSDWTFEFALNNQSAPLVGKDGFIDGEKLLNMQVIVLYEATVF